MDDYLQDCRNAYVRALNSATRLSGLVKQRVRLEKHGPRQVGLCPFHSEKTPSFFVDDATGTFHCKGCGQRGTAIDWLRHVRGCSEQEAIVELAQTAIAWIADGAGLVADLRQGRPAVWDVPSKTPASSTIGTDDDLPF